MMPLTPGFLVAAASAFVGVRADDGARGEAMVRRIVAMANVPPDRSWGTAFVSYVGYWSQYDQWRGEPRWPLPVTWDPHLLAFFAREVGVLVETPAPGDVFVAVRQDTGEYVHAGIVVRAFTPIARGREEHDCISIEGDACDAAGRGCHAVVRRPRILRPWEGDRCIRWADLDDRDTHDGRIRPGRRTAA